MQTKGIVLSKLAQVLKRLQCDAQEFADEAGVTRTMVQRALEGHGCFQKTLERYAHAAGKPNVYEFLKEAI